MQNAARMLKPRVDAMTVTHKFNVRIEMFTLVMSCFPGDLYR